MGKADLHIHTTVSDGLASVEALLTHVAGLDLDIVAITDHEDIRGGLRAAELAARRGYRFAVLPGVEVTTLQGHVVAFGLPGTFERAPKSFRTVERTLEAIHTAGGLAVAPHPGSRLTRSISSRTLDRLAARREAGTWFDAIETANTSPAGRHGAAAVRERNEGVWWLPEVGASDAHHLVQVGTGYTEYPGEGVGALIQALRAGTTVARVARYPSLRDVGAGRALLGLAWGFSATPRKMVAPAFRRRPTAP